MKRVHLSWLGAFVAVMGTIAPMNAQIEGRLDDQTGADSSATGAWLEGDAATGDWGGLRHRLADHGVEIFAGYTAEVWGNTTGGLETGSVYTGLLDFGTNLDFEKLVGWDGASFSTTWLWLSGRDASEDLVGNFFTISSIAGFNTLRMLEMWFQQDLFEGVISLRLGQLTADSEFVISDHAALFINGTFGWPAFLYTNVPEGGPGYPMGAPGIRLALNPVDWARFQTAVFQGDVFAQNVNRHGFRWRLDSQQGFFWINEGQVRWNQSDNSGGLGGQFKAGAWFHSGEFTTSFGDGSVWGNYGFYFIIDQQLFRESGGELPAPIATKQARSAKSGKSFQAPVEAETPALSNQGLGWFTRIAFEPQDRNFVGFYFDTGFVYTGLIPGRDGDQFGLGFAVADLTNAAAQTLYDEGSRKVGQEMVIEATYAAAITPWLTIQPDLQYVMRPGGTGDLGNAFVLGCRASITF